MDLLPSPQQLEIASSSASFLTTNLPTTRTREMIDERSNVDDRAWAAAANLGWFALGIPEADGGVGCGLADEALLFREIGRSLASGPFLSTVLAARVASFGGLPDLAAQIVGGAKVGLAIPEGAAAGHRDTVHGALQLLDAVGADLVVFAGPKSAGLLRMADLADVVPDTCIDETTRLAHANAHEATPVVIVDAEVDPVERRGIVLVAALQTGIAEATRDIAAEHAKTRVQFGHPIGVNQAVKHPCADMAVRSELAWAQTLVAALAVDEHREDAELQALMAKVVAGHAAQQNAGATIQVLGGMGFTFEHNANLYLKRAYVLDHLFGVERDTLSRLIELPAS